MWRRLAVDHACRDGYTCESVWGEDVDPTDLVVVGRPVEDGTVPLSDGEVAVRIKREIIADAEIR